MKAIILAAGRGTRLRPLTDHVPKCLVQVQGKPLLQYALESLDRAGIQHCVIVVGYLWEQVQRQFGSRFRNMHLTYIMNKRFLETNNLYSLWLARQEMDDDIFLLEGDLLFEEDLLLDLSQSPHSDVAVVDRFQPSMDGTLIMAEGGMTTSMVLKSEQPPGFDYHDAFKTVNIYKLSRATMTHQFLPTLDRYVAQSLTDQFYEVALAHLVAQGDLQLAVHLTGARQWMEIDTEEDLRHAEAAVHWSWSVGYAGFGGTGAEKTASRGPAPAGTGLFRRR